MTFINGTYTLESSEDIVPSEIDIQLERKPFSRELKKIEKLHFLIFAFLCNKHPTIINHLFLESERYNFLIGTSIKSTIYRHCRKNIKMDDSTNHDSNILFRSVSTVHSHEIPYHITDKMLQNIFKRETVVLDQIL